MNGEEVPVKKNGDGSFTVEHVSGNLTVSELSRSGRTFSVSVTGSGRNDVTAEAAATEGKDYSFETVSMAKLLAADVNGDGAVTVLDAAAIVNSVIGQ